MGIRVLAHFSFGDYVMKTFILMTFIAIVSVGFSAEAEKRDFSITEFIKTVEAHGGGMTSREESELRDWLREDYQNNRKLEIWLANMDLDQELRKDIVRILVDI
jgi:hypothetical protein